MLDLLLKYVVMPIVIFVGGYIFLRITGKRAVSEMNSFDLLLILVVGTVISQPLVSQNTFEALYYGAFFILLYKFFGYLTLYNKLHWILIARPTVLLRNGDIDERGLRKEQMTTDELVSKLRIKGYTNPKDIEMVMMESVGQISIIPKAHIRPIQPNDIQLQPSPTFIPIPIIMNGQIIEENLTFMKKDREWLDMQLKAYQKTINTISDITLAVYNQQGILDIDTNDPTNTNTHEPFNYKPN